jgi:hypothetical protein
VIHRGTSHQPPENTIFKILIPKRKSFLVRWIFVQVKNNCLWISYCSERLESLQIIFVNKLDVSQSMSRLEIDFPRVLDRVQGLPDRLISNRVDQEVETFALTLDVLQLPHVLGQSGLKSNFSVSKLTRFKFQKLKKHKFSLLMKKYVPTKYMFSPKYSCNSNRNRIIY